MMQIVWNREELERNIRLEKGEFRLLDFWMPVQLYINGVDITGLDTVPGGDISRIDDLFLSIFFAFKSIDPEKLGDKEFYFIGSFEDEVFAGGFKFYIDHDKQADNLTIRYSNFVHRKFQSISIPLKQFTEGFLLSTKELLEEVKSIDPAYCSHEEIVILQDNMAIIRNWYKERYGSDALLKL